ncbi:hypothetical protein [Azospirillum sp.]|uniref:hypothetical protein n=1 Tax=Azospirillum sp. TaxID=34012 RepID=UPI003D739A9F
MPLSVLEVAIYAMVLTAADPKPYECVSVQPDGVNCTNGLFAEPLPGGGMKFNTGVTVAIGRDRSVTFSNGIQIHLDSSAWAHFKRGTATIVSARRTDPKGSRFAFNNGYACQILDQELARCFKVL